MADQNKDFLRKLLATFRTEAEETLRDIVSNIVLLEQASEGAQKDFVERILKKLHTLKGAARAVNLTDMEMLCHAMESVFSAVRVSAFALGSEQFDMIHQASSVAQALLQEPTGRVRNQAAALIKRLERLSAEIAVGETNGTPLKASTDSVEPDLMQASTSGGREIGVSVIEASGIAKADVIRVQSKNLDAIRYQAEALLSIELGLQHHISELMELADDIADHRHRRLIAEASAQTTMQQRQSEPLANMFHSRKRSPRAAHQLDSRAMGDDVYNSRLELRCRRLAGALGRTRRNFLVVRSKLMEATLETALEPFSSALEQLPGLVRNLARSEGKEAVLSVEGEGIRIDRRILDIVREALIHLVTNAVGHGIESIEKRLASGKQVAGVVLVKVAQCGSNQVSITVADDGVGIDVTGVVTAAARARNLNADQITMLNDQQKMQLALLAGVSTSMEVTQVSGRGVGLAIVAERIASVGGDLSIQNSAGAGCSFQMTLPVRLTTLRGLVLRTKGSPYVVPLSGIEEVRALKAGDIRTVESRETLLIGGHVIPAIRLGHLLGLAGSTISAAGDENIAVVARAGGKTFAFLVDEILSEQEVLPKTLGKQLRRVRFITGATQLGDGSLVPILGLEDIARYGLAIGDGAIPAGRPSIGASQLKRVLVTEDSITSRLLLKHILEDAGYQVETAVDGLDALSKLRHHDFDALVSDIEMPRLDGLALTEQVRGNPKTAEMPVVLVTSLQSPEEKERGLRAGADAYVVKGSFDQDNLLATIRRLI
jgi:two-component system chemotaxis sensor kinase CheA